MVAIDALAKLITGSSNYFHDQGTLGFGRAELECATGSRRLSHRL